MMTNEKLKCCPVCGKQELSVRNVCDRVEHPEEPYSKWIECEACGMLLMGDWLDDKEKAYENVLYKLNNFNELYATFVTYESMPYEHLRINGNFVKDAISLNLDKVKTMDGTKVSSAFVVDKKALLEALEKEQDKQLNFSEFFFYPM